MGSPRCASCHAPLTTPVACKACGALQTIPAGTDHFRMLGLPRQYCVDEKLLEKSYRSTSRLVHPDFFGDKPKTDQEKAMRLTALLNDAYRTLRDPVARAEYLVRIAGGPTASADRSTPQGFLVEMLNLREEAEEPGLPPERQAGLLADVEARIGQLLSELDGMFSSEARLSREQLAGIRSALNSYYYLQTLRESLGGEKRLRH